MQKLCLVNIEYQCCLAHVQLSKSSWFNENIQTHVYSKCFVYNYDGILSQLNIEETSI